MRPLPQRFRISSLKNKVRIIASCAPNPFNIKYLRGIARPIADSKRLTRRARPQVLLIQEFGDNSQGSDELNYRVFKNLVKNNCSILTLPGRLQAAMRTLSITPPRLIAEC